MLELSTFISIGSLVVTMYLAFSIRRKNESEAKKNDSESSEKISAAAVALVNPLKERITDLEIYTKQLKNNQQQNITLIQDLRKRIDNLKKQNTKQQSHINEITRGVSLLQAQVKKLGHKPVYQG